MEEGWYTAPEARNTHMDHAHTHPCGSGHSDVWAAGHEGPGVQAPLWDVPLAQGKDAGKLVALSSHVEGDLEGGGDQGQAVGPNLHHTHT